MAGVTGREKGQRHEKGDESTLDGGVPPDNWAVEEAPVGSWTSREIKLVLHGLHSSLVTWSGIYPGNHRPSLQVRPMCPSRRRSLFRYSQRSSSVNFILDFVGTPEGHYERLPADITFQGWKYLKPQA